MLPLAKHLVLPVISKCQGGSGGTADTLALGANARKRVEVQILSPAPSFFRSQFIKPLRACVRCGSWMKMERNRSRDVFFNSILVRSFSPCWNAAFATF